MARASEPGSSVRVRPSYFAFKLLARLTGERVKLDSGDASVHGFASWDPKLLTYNVLLWNYSATPAQVDLAIDGATTDLTLRQLFLDAAASSDDENIRLRPVPGRRFKQGEMRTKVELGAYGISFLALEKDR